MSYENQPVVITQKKTKARKVHRCCECKANIQPRDFYERTSGIWEDSGPNRYATCLPCAELRTRLESDDGYIFGGLIDEVAEGEATGADADAFRKRVEDRREVLRNAIAVVESY